MKATLAQPKKRSKITYTSSFAIQVFSCTNNIFSRTKQKSERKNFLSSVEKSFRFRSAQGSGSRQKCRIEFVIGSKTEDKLRLPTASQPWVSSMYLQIFLLTLSLGFFDLAAMAMQFLSALNAASAVVAIVCTSPPEV